MVHPDRLRRYQVPFQQVWQQSGQPYRFPLTLISKRIRRGIAEFRVRWLSVDPTPDSWLAARHLPAHLIAGYEARQQRPIDETTSVLTILVS